MNDENQMLPQIPGTPGNSSLGALSRLMEDRQRLSEDLQGQYKAAQGQRDVARSAMDDAYEQAMAVLKKPVQDNTWLQMALAAARPVMPGQSWLLNAADAANTEQKRVRDLTQQNAMAASQLGINMQSAKMKEAQDLSDKLLAAVGRTTGGAGVGNTLLSQQAQAHNAFARQATTLFTQQLEGARKQAEAMTNLTPEERNTWVQQTARQNTYSGLRQLLPLYQKSGVNISEADLDKFIPGQEVSGMVASKTAAQTPINATSDAINIMPQFLPPEVQQEVERQIMRMNTNPADQTLRANTLARLRQIAVQYPQAKPTQEQMQQEFGATPPQAGQTIAETKAQAAGMKAKAEELAKSGEPSGKIIYNTYEKLQDLPSNVQTWNSALEAWDKSKSQFGTGAEFLNATKSFLNNRLGMGLTPEEVSNAQVFAASMDRYAAQQLRQTDSQPAVKQLEMLRKAIGTLENDPNAVPKIIQNLHKLTEIQAEGHNKRVSQAMSKGLDPYFDLRLNLPPVISKFGTDKKTGKRVAQYSDGTVKFVGE